jgi:hypothetical protein
MWRGALGPRTLNPKTKWHRASHTPGAAASLKTFPGPLSTGPACIGVPAAPGATGRTDPWRIWHVAVRRGVAVCGWRGAGGRERLAPESLSSPVWQRFWQHMGKRAVVRDAPLQVRRAAAPSLSGTLACQGACMSGCLVQSVRGEGVLAAHSPAGAPTCSLGIRCLCGFTLSAAVCKVSGVRMCVSVHVRVWRMCATAHHQLF